MYIVRKADRRMIILLQTVAIQFHRFFTYILLQDNFFTKCDSLILQSVLSTTKCDRLLLQSTSGILKQNRSYYKVSQLLQGVIVITKWEMIFKKLEPRIVHHVVLMHLKGISDLFANGKN